VWDLVRRVSNFLAHMTLDDFVKVQTSIVGAIGFTGVMITVWWSARVARQGRLATLRQARRTLRTALREELTLVRARIIRVERVIREVVRKLPPRDTPYEANDHVAVDEIPTLGVYDTLLKDIGILRQNQVKLLIEAHASISLVRNATTTPNKKADYGMVTIPLNNAGYVLKCIEDALDKTDKAYTALL
jgi:hypothetical protein